MVLLSSAPRIFNKLSLFGIVLDVVVIGKCDIFGHAIFGVVGYFKSPEVAFSYLTSSGMFSIEVMAR